MITIPEILAKANPTMEELIYCLEMVKESGDVAVIKFDGERTENAYTVFISFPNRKDKGLLRSDDDELKKPLIKVLKGYFEGME
ncbi:MAG: hypothetical protein H6581_25550 [Bacteroidia bacterium]|nr:hypothetical protein [Bacteroidia bacterium]